MKAATISELKKELKLQSKDTLVETCIRLAKFKKDNKELLTYLLYEVYDEQSYVNSVKREIDEGFKALNRRSIFYVKKTVRKVLKLTDKYIRYSGNKQSEVEIRIYFCKRLIDLKLPLRRSPQLNNLYLGQIKKIETAMNKLHEDVRLDYEEDLEDLLL